MRAGMREWLVALLAGGAVMAIESRANAAPAVNLVVDPSSTCEGAATFASRLPARGVTVSSGAAATARVRAVTTSDGAEASLVIESGGRTATRALTAPTCDEVLEALAFALSLSLEQPEPAPAPPPPSPAPAPPIEPSRSLRWGADATFGIFAGASPNVAPALVAHADLESASKKVLAPSASLGVAIVFPSTTTRGAADLAFAMQTGLLDGCPIRLGGRLSVRPCVELQIGRLESRSALVPGARLASSTWAALGLTVRGRAEIGAGISAELALTGGSALIQDSFAIGNSGVFDTGPFVFSATLGAGVHFW